MAVSIKMYSKFPELLCDDKFVSLGSETAIKCSLHTSSYTPAQATDDYFNDIVGEVVSTGTGYTPGGATMTTTALASTSVVMSWDTANTSWASSTISARYAVLRDSTVGAASSQPLICYIDFGADKVSENGTFQLTWNAAGIFTMTVAS